MDSRSATCRGQARQQQKGQQQTVGKQCVVCKTCKQCTLFICQQTAALLSFD
jgi:hypothetical protein